MTPIRRRGPRAVGGLVVLATLALLATAAAAQQPATAEIVKMTRPVDVLPRGQSAWVAAAPGMRLADGDQIRALSGGSAELALPDRSTIFVSENTRFAVTRLEHDPRTGARTSAFHLVVGKVRTEVTRASVQLVRTRQSNFTISTPLGVAGVRGTRMVVAYTPPTGAPPPPGQPPPQAGQPPAVAAVAAAEPAAQAAQAPRIVQAGEQVLLICLPSPGQPRDQAQCLYHDPVTKATMLLLGFQFTIHPSGQALGAPASTGVLPAGLAGLLSDDNPGTLNSPFLTDPNVQIPRFQPIPFGGRAAIIDPSVFGGGGTSGQISTSLGQDSQQLSPGPDEQQCASPPC